MQQFYAIITLFALQAHTLLGCCMHHEHHCAHGRCEEGAMTLAATADSDCPHHAHESSEENADQQHSPGDRPHDPHRCEGVSCVFAWNANSHPEQQALQADATCLSLATIAMPAPAGTANSERRSIAAFPAATALRTHLCKHVLLI